MARKTIQSEELGRNQLRVRMYRVGFGDCFLISFPANEGHSHVLVDFGVHFNGDIGKMPEVMADIEKETKRHLAIVIATHVHQDHISGFGKFADRFAEFSVGEVWLPWTEDPRDPEAMKLRKKHTELQTRVAKFFDGSTPAKTAKKEVNNILLNLSPNQKAMQVLRSGFKDNPKVRYLAEGSDVDAGNLIERLSVRILGPSRDSRFLAKMKQPSDDHFLRMVEGENGEIPLKPFPDHFCVGREAFQTQYGTLALFPQTYEEIHALAEESPDALAAALNVCMNNSSLVTLFSFGQEKPLFPGDAEYANWQWWTKLPDADDILSQINFLKVAHHGSVNATPKKVLEKMGDIHGSENQFSAMVSTQNKPWESIPRKPLMDALEKRTGGKVARSDSVTWDQIPADAPSGPPLGALSKNNFKEGPFWIDYIVKP